MKTEQVSKQIITAILLTLDDNFKKKFKMPLRHEEKVLISSQDIMSSKQYHIDKLMKKKSIQSLGDSSQVFDDLLKKSIENHPIYTIESIINRFKQTVLYVKRKCKYVDQHNIIGTRNLINYIYLNHMGTLIDEQLLNFTYAGIDTDIENGVNDRTFIKMPMVVRNIEQYTLFPNLEESIYQIPIVEGLHFQEEYQDLCKQFLNHQQRTYQQEENTYIQIQINNRDPNYKLKGFKEMKMQWKIMQAMKEHSTKEHERRKEKQEIDKVPNRKNRLIG